jgi:DNA-binding CsgD family transcriptional regulator
VEQASGRIDRLTPRERDVLTCIAASYNLEGIADYLGLSPKTVENHSTTIYDKLGLKNVSAQAPTLRKTVIVTKACILHDLRQGA